MRLRPRQPLLDAAGALHVRRVLYLNGLGRDEVEDAMQEIELRALERPLRERASATAWACAVATNLAVDAHRRARRDAATAALASSQRLQERTDTTDLREALRGGLAGLPPELRAAVVLRFYADFTIPQIARAMAVPEGAIKSRLHRALGQLRRRLPLEAMT